MTALLPSQSVDTFTDALVGDRDALDDLLRQHRPAVEAVCFRRLRSRIDAEDAVQETMLKGLRSLHHVEDPSRLRGYLCRIAERVCLDMLRAGARAMPEQFDQPADERDEPEAVALERERAELVHRTLQALSERQATALWMRDAMGEPVPTVARELGVTEGSARVLLTRARAKMRDGWAKVAAFLPGFGLKLPAALGTKIAQIGPLGIPAAVPALAVVAAVAVSPVAIRTVTEDRGPTVAIESSFPRTFDKADQTVSATRHATPASGASTPSTSPTSTRAMSTSTTTTTTPDQPDDPVLGDPVTANIAGQEVTAGEERRPADEEEQVTVGPDELLQLGAEIDPVNDALGRLTPRIDLGGS